MSLYSSWGRQANFSAKPCPSPQVMVEGRNSLVVAVCRQCGWQSPNFRKGDQAQRFAAHHTGEARADVERIESVAQVRDSLGLEQWPTPDPPWACRLVGQPVRLLDELATVPELLEAAVGGETIVPDDDVPDDPGDASLEGLHAGWAAKTNDTELELVSHWAIEPPTMNRLPLRESFAPDLYSFLLDRVPLYFAYLHGERHPLVERGILQDAGFVAVTEQRRRSREPEPASSQLDLIVLGLIAQRRPSAG